MGVILYHEDGSTVDCPADFVDFWLTKPGWTREAPALPPPAPVLDLASYEAAQLLHAADILRIEVPSTSTREGLELLLHACWRDAGCPDPSEWMTLLLEMQAPIAAEDFPVPQALSINETVETADQFAERAKTVLPEEEEPEEGT